MKKNKKPIGRPKNKEKTVIYFRRVHPNLVKPMDDYLKDLKQQHKEVKLAVEATEENNVYKYGI